MEKNIRECEGKIPEAREKKNGDLIQVLQAKNIEHFDVDLDTLDFEKNLYVLHQTHCSHIDSIMKNGLHTTNGLNGTASRGNKASMESVVQSMKMGRGHNGSNALVIMEFPKAEFKTKEKIQLDDISDFLFELGYNGFTIPPKYIKMILKIDHKR